MISIEKLQQLRDKIKGDIRLIVSMAYYDYVEGDYHTCDQALMENISDNIEVIGGSIISYNIISGDDSEDAQYYTSTSRDIHDLFLSSIYPSDDLTDELDCVYQQRGMRKCLKQYNPVIEESLVKYHQALFYIEDKIKERNDYLSS